MFMQVIQGRAKDVAVAVFPTVTRHRGSPSRGAAGGWA